MTATITNATMLAYDPLGPVLLQRGLSSLDSFEHAGDFAEFGISTGGDNDGATTA